MLVCLTFMKKINAVHNYNPKVVTLAMYRMNSSSSILGGLCKILTATITVTIRSTSLNCLIIIINGKSGKGF